MVASRGDADVVEVLTNQHRKAEELFRQLQQRSGDVDELRNIADQVIIELVRHSVAEEEHLYPAVRHYVSGGDEIVDHELAEHAQAEHTMKQLEAVTASEPRFDDLVAQLVDEIGHHVSDEEQELFPKLTRQASHEILQTLGHQVAALTAAAPTRAEASSLDAPLLTELLPTGAGLATATRSALSERTTR